jgi:hypothetical protein
MAVFDTITMVGGKRIDIQIYKVVLSIEKLVASQRFCLCITPVTALRRNATSNP